MQGISKPQIDVNNTRSGSERHGSEELNDASESGSVTRIPHGFPRTPFIPGLGNIRDPHLRHLRLHTTRTPHYSNESPTTLESQLDILPLDPIPGAARFNTINLAETLDMELLKQSACKMGRRVYCPHRHHLYSVCFEHLIRQATNECRKRGLLLQRIRDEGRLLLICYDGLLTEACEFGSHMLVKCEQERNGNQELADDKLISLEEENTKLRNENQHLQFQIDQLQHTDKNRKKISEKARGAELQLLRRSNQQLQSALDSLKSLKIS